MEKKINIAELLKDCPKGMELDSPVWNNITFEEIDGDNIVIFRKSIGSKVYLSQCGDINSIDGKCIIFPKGKTTWEGFVSPCKFKNGDILTYTSNYTTTFIYRNKDNEPNFSTSFYVACNNAPSHNFLIYNKNTLIALNENCDVRLATEEEKQKLYDAIKANGYKWNAGTKTLEKLVEPKFKVGDVIQDIDTYKVKITEVSIEDECYGYESMIAKGIGSITFSEQDNWELVPNKFDINTLVPFESKVLVRNVDGDLWKPAIYGFLHSKGCYVVGGIYWRQCIPYEANRELLGTTNDCDDYYNTWE